MKGVGAQNTFNLKMKCSKPKNKVEGGTQNNKITHVKNTKIM